MAGDVQTFEAAAFTDAMAAYVGVPSMDITVDARAASIEVDATIFVRDGSDDSLARIQRLVSVDAATWSEILGVEVLAVGAAQLSSEVRCPLQESIHRQRAAGCVALHIFQEAEHTFRRVTPAKECLTTE